jgi:hypothetical protein
VDKSENVCATRGIPENPHPSRQLAENKGGLVGRDPLLGAIRLSPLDYAIRRQTRVADFIEQSTVADAQCARRLLAVPMMFLQNFQDDLSL